MATPQSAAELRAQNHEYQRASAPCDLVLKGGAASGFVYSGAIVELARVYRFQSIGGTSAGAGAAGVAAAAEYGRRSGNEEAWGFAGIEHVPEWAAERTGNGWSRLKHLFGPDPETARLYDVVVAPFTASTGGVSKAIRAALGGYWQWTATGALDELKRAGFSGSPEGHGLTEEQLARMEQLTKALLDEEEHVPEPGKPGWPDHPALKPKFVMRVMPDA